MRALSITDVRRPELVENLVGIFLSRLRPDRQGLFGGRTNAEQGGDNRLEITLLKQEPSARCYGSADVPGIFESCVSLMNDMDGNPWFQTVGIGAGVDVTLPYTKRSGEVRSLVTKWFDGLQAEY